MYWEGTYNRQIQKLIYMYLFSCSLNAYLLRGSVVPLRTQTNQCETFPPK